MEVIKCDNCQKEMTDGNDFYALNRASIGFFTSYSSTNHGPPPVRHFCNNECIFEWAGKQVTVTKAVLDWVKSNDSK